MACVDSLKPYLWHKPALQLVLPSSFPLSAMLYPPPRSAYTPTKTRARARAMLTSTLLMKLAWNSKFLLVPTSSCFFLRIH